MPTTPVAHAGGTDARAAASALEAAITVKRHATDAAAAAAAAVAAAAPGPPAPPAAAHESLRLEVQHTVRDTVHHMEGFFTHFLGHVGLFLLVALLVCLAGYAALRCIKAGARACGAPDNCSVQLRYVVGALVVYVALSAGFATLGLDFPHIVLSLGFATIALGAGFAACFANMVAGFTLRDDADFRLGTRALTWYGGVQYSGVVTEMSLRHVVLYDADTGRRHRLPNALFETSPTTILYDGGGGGGGGGAAAATGLPPTPLSGAGAAAAAAAGGGDVWFGPPPGAPFASAAPRPRAGGAAAIVVTDAARPNARPPGTMTMDEFRRQFLPKQQ